MVAVEESTIEDVASFRSRACEWIRENLSPLVPLPDDPDITEQLAEVQRHREIQRMFFDAGFAGIMVPKAYGGQGLTHDHVRAFNEEISGYEFPAELQIPTFTPALGVVLEFGTEEQKQRHVPAILKGERIFAQFLSEPRGGSDTAGAITTAVKDGDEWVLNGSKIWTSSAWKADWCICLARTNWDVEKHRGLTVFFFPIATPGIDIRPIEMVNGTGRGHTFCQDFLTDVRVSDADRIGNVDEGWSVGVRWMYYERSLFASPLVTWPAVGASPGTGGSDDALIRIARKTNKISDPLSRNMIGEVHANTVITPIAHKRIHDGMRTGHLSDQGAALIRLMRGADGSRKTTVSFDLASGTGVAWTEDEKDLGKTGMDFLARQAGSLGGGTTEMARNVISERILGMPRERSADRDVAYRDVPQGPPSH